MGSEMCIRDRNVEIIWWEDIMLSGLPSYEYILNRLGDRLLKPRPTYLSVDIDGFSNAYAMGCSQSWSTGFSPQGFFPLLQVLMSNLDVQVLGIYEVSPPLDLDDRTSKLAAQILYAFAHQDQK